MDAGRIVTMLLLGALLLGAMVQMASHPQQANALVAVPADGVVGLTHAFEGR